VKAALQYEPAATPALEEFEEPVAAEGEVLIRVRTAGLGGQDIVGAYQDGMRYPCVVRAEGVGFDENGRRVYFGERSRLPFGAFAEYTVVPEAEVWEVPDDISDQLAITMGISGTGAYVPLRDAARIQDGDAVLVLGATGAVGQVGLQLARHMGAARVVAAGRSREALDGLVQRGVADAGVVLQTGDAAARAAEHHRETAEKAYESGIAEYDAVLQSGDDVAALREQSGGDGYDVVLDILYGHYFSTAAKATRPGARLVTIGAPAGLVASIAAPDLSYRYHTSWGTGQAPPQERHQTWLELLELGRQGIDVNYKEFPFDQSAEAYEAQRSSPHAKVIVSVSA
jgi:NADPH:quinone reductase-like Zn-dependent oxidoreductase